MRVQLRMASTCVCRHSLTEIRKSDFLNLCQQRPWRKLSCTMPCKQRGLLLARRFSTSRMNYRSQLFRVRLACLRIARHLQLIVIILFMLYVLGAVTLLFAMDRVPSFGAAIGAIIFMAVPIPVFACEFLAVFVRWIPASYLCTGLWLIAAAWICLLQSRLPRRQNRIRQPLLLHLSYSFRLGWWH